MVYTSVKGAKEALGASSAHAAALWPMVAVGEKKYYFSAMFAALTAYTDAGNSDVPYESPSNKDLKITKTVLKDGTEVLLDQQQANDLLNANGAGYRTEFKSDENPITNLLDGHLTVHTYLAPYIPAEYIENIREYDTEALEAALTGGGE